MGFHKDLRRWPDRNLYIDLHTGFHNVLSQKFRKSFSIHITPDASTDIHWWKYSHHESTHEGKPTQNKHVRLANKLDVRTFALACSEEYIKGNSKKKITNFHSRAIEQSVIYYGFTRQIKYISIESAVNYQFVVKNLEISERNLLFLSKRNWLWTSSNTLTNSFSFVCSRAWLMRVDQHSNGREHLVLFLFQNSKHIRRIPSLQISRLRSFLRISQNLKMSPQRFLQSSP